MNTAIAIGCYRLAQFAELCVRRCRTLFPAGTPILLSDDKSARSPQIEALAEKYGAAYVCPPSRRSHFSGDMQTFLNGLVFAREAGADILLKISQRFIPVLPEFVTAMERTFADPRILIALPGRPALNQISRPQARFYSKFGILTDVVALRTSAITPEDLMAVYQDRVRHPKNKSDSFSETTWGWLLCNRFADSHRIIQEWTNHVAFRPKVYLRKSQATNMDYQKVAAMEGMTGEWDLREWAVIEKGEYVARPTRV